MTITANSSVADVVMELGDGNIGAITVCGEMLKRPDGFGLLYLLHADDMGLRGPAIWIGYKDHCGEDIEKFAKALQDRDPEMVSVIKANGHDATTGGASFR